MKITIAIPTNRGVQPQTMQCLLELIEENKDKDIEIIVSEEGYTIAENRNYIAVQAINNNSDYLLMIDDDMIFEADIIDKMIENKKDIVGVPFHPRCDDMKVIDEAHYLKAEKRNEIFESNVGTGIILIKCSCLKEIPRPWFMFDYYKTGQVAKGEDWYFCDKAKENGFKVWLDPKIKVGHIGEAIF